MVDRFNFLLLNNNFIRITSVFYMFLRHASLNIIEGRDTNLLPKGIYAIPNLQTATA